MYQLQRGPMLGDVAGHADERALLHSCFVAASGPVASLIMAPDLYLLAPGTAAFQQVPALDLALQPGQLRCCRVCVCCTKLNVHEVVSLRSSSTGIA